MKRTLLIAVTAIVLILPAASFAEANDPEVTTGPQDVVYTAESALEFLKSMSGDWDGTSAENRHGSYPAINFRVMAAGSTVVETVLQGHPNEMESVFHMDGDDLLLTHYCALQNAPVLRFERSDEPGLIQFVFHGGTNFDPAVDAHFHEGTFKIVGADTVESTFVVVAGGKPQPEGSSVLKRQAE